MNNQSYHTDGMDEYPGIFLTMAELEETDVPVTPLPSPSEDDPVDSGGNQSNGANIPVIPLPNLDEGDPTDSGNHPGLPPILRPIFPDNSSSVTVIPDVTLPCYNCIATNFGRVRTLNVSAGYQPFHVYLGNRMATSGLGNGDVTGYVQSTLGTQTVIVSGVSDYVYTQKIMQVRAPASMTIAAANTVSDLDIMGISDISCSTPPGTSRPRTCNLSLNLGPLDVSIGNQNPSYTTFSNVRYREVTLYISFYLGWYQLYISRTSSYPNISVATASANMSASISYTLHIFNALNAMDGLKTLIASG